MRPVSAAKKPLVAHWKVDATTDPVTIEAWLRKWLYVDFAWALPPGVVVVDIDIKHGKNGYSDFRRLTGCDSQDVATAAASTPSGGMQLFYAATKPYKNAVAIAGTGIDTRAEGGYVVLPGEGNGREWLRALIGADGAIAPLLPAPAWLNCALKPASLVLAPRTALALALSDPYAQRKAQADLARACAKIVAAPCGAQDAERHRQSYFVGGLVARGDLDYAEAYAALLEAALAMPAYCDPWRNLETRVARSIEAGMAAPLALSETEQWIRDFRARMRLKRPPTSTGARNG
jgi:Bifunctional DNA primase/polymerase, N-terminal